ncbi:hypothetical protein ETI06_00475 [Macrococcoides goetzii]|nr:hypothetical protein [Macrococcus goetzii]TDM50484.1 hypothetical protein ETI06_00475 [Macrococcus goetzii]
MKHYLVKNYFYFSLFTAFLLYLFLTGNGHLHPLEIIFISLLMFGYLLFIWPEAKIKYDDFNDDNQKYLFRLKYQKVSIVFAVFLLLINLFSSIYLYFQHYDIFLMILIGFIWSVFTIGMIKTNMKLKREYTAFIERQNTSER